MSPNKDAGSSRKLIVCGLLLALSGGCSRVYYATMEKFGKEKRDILVGRVEDVRKEQDKAKEQFQTTLEAFQALTGAEGGELEKVYEKLDKEYQRSESRAKEVSDKIDSIQKVSRDLFKEWKTEIGEISDSGLRVKSEQLRRETEERYEAFAERLQNTEAKMYPVLQAFRDQVLFLKHNLNAQSVDALRETVLEVDGDVADLVRDIEESIREADAFIASMSLDS